MRKYGGQKFLLVPLEVIKLEEYANVKPTKSDKYLKVRAFHKLASPREMFWIDKLRTFTPVGFNVSHGRRRKRYRLRVSNPMKRHKNVLESKSIDYDRSDGSDDELDRKHVGEVPKATKPAMRWYGSRDWERRLKYLEEKFNIGTLGRVNWEKYSPRSLHCMLGYLNSGECKLSAAAEKTLTTTLNGVIKLRLNLTKKVKESKPYIRLLYVAHGLRTMGLKSILLEKEVSNLFPDPDEDFSEYVICKKLVEPIGQKLLNFRSVAKRLEGKAGDCPCRKLFASKFRPDNQCVLTGDLSLVRNDTLRLLISYGPNFREHVDSDPMAAIRKGLREFITHHSWSTDRSRVAYNAWARAVFDKCAERLSPLPLKPVPSKTDPMLLNPAVAKHLKFLQQFLVLVPVDKAASNIAFVCKSLYVEQLKKELSRADGAYEPEARSQEEILSDHGKFLQPMKLVGAAKLPYLYWSPKFHKQPTGQRFIAGSSECSTTQVSEALSGVLTHVMRTLRSKDNEHIRKTGIRRYFTVETFEEVTHFLAKWKRFGSCRQMYTGDFSTMYTTIPHADLTRAVRVACEEAFLWQASRSKVIPERVRLGWSKDGAKWQVTRFAGGRHSGREHTFDVDEIVNLVEFLIENTFLVNGDTIRRQKIGIPMGTNCAPVLANLYLYVYESEFIDRVAAKSKDKARRFHMTFRFIDDLLSLDNTDWPEAVSKSATEGGLYPSELELGDTSIADDESHFLGLHVKAVEDRFRVSVFDKRQTFPFEVRRYPRMDSLIPPTIPYGVFLGQLHRAYRICSDWHGFLDQSMQVAQRLVTNGCTKQRLVRVYRTFVRQHVRKYSVKAHALCKDFQRELGN